MIKKKNSYQSRFWGNMSQYNKSYLWHTNIQYDTQLWKLKTELPYDPAFPLLGIYPEKTLIQKDTCTPEFTAVLLTIAKTWK